MIDTPRIPPTTPGKAPVIQAPSNQNILHNVPTSILTLPKDTTIQGTVIRQDAQGNTQIQTNNGTVSLKTPLALQTGNTLHLRLLTSGNNVELQLVSVNGKPPNTLPHLPHTATVFAKSHSGSSNDFIFRSTYAPPSPSTSTGHTTPATHTQIQGFQEGRIFQATFTAPRPETIEKVAQHFSVEPKTGKLTPQTPNTPPALKQFINAIRPGHTITLQILSGTIPVVTPSPSSTSTPLPGTTPSATSPQTGVTPNATPSTPLPSPAILKTAYTNTTSIHRPASSTSTVLTTSPATTTSIPAQNNQTITQTTSLPQTPPKNIPQQGSPNQQPTPNTPITIPSTQIPTPSIQLTNTALPQITGVVIGTEKSGDIVLNTPIGNLKLPFDTPLPKDATLTFALIALPGSVTINQVAQTLPNAKPDGIPQLLKHWQSLDDVSETLHKTDRSNADTLLRQVLPTADKNLGIRLLNFISAIKTGDAKQWLGPQIIAVLQKAGKGDLIEKVGKEFATLRAVASDSSNTQWQTVLFPVYDGEELHQTRMFVRHYDQEGSDSEEKEPNARFIVEVELQRLGAVQLDGLIRKQKNIPNFDLIVRSSNPMPDNMKNDITTIFTDTLEITGLTGRISFEQTDHFPINPSEDILSVDSSSNSSILT